MTRFLSIALLTLCAAFFAAGFAAPARAQPAAQIVWEAANRFRLFRDEKDFRLHAEALQGGRTILQSEQVLAQQSEGRGWARNLIGRLCVTQAGRVAEPCERDGVLESYLAPVDARVTARLVPAPPGGCVWTIEDGAAPRQATAPCGAPFDLRAPTGRSIRLSVMPAADAGAAEAPPPGDDSVARPALASTEIAVRDVLIAGLGDSIASGEGNPDRPVALSDDGFCFRRFLDTGAGEYYRPARAGYRGDKSCAPVKPGETNVIADWQRYGAQWMNTPCHRSLYSYQIRAAIALAVQNPHLTVTFLPLACTGATIEAGLVGAQKARECVSGRNGLTCNSSVPPQITQLNEMLAGAKRRNPARALDLVLLTIGANDIGFSEMVADVMVASSTERLVFRRSGTLTSVEEADQRLDALPRSFATLRAALRPLTGNQLGRVLFTSYANPALAAADTACGGGQAGFDVHPSFDVNAEKLARAVQFVDARFLPRLKAYAQCEGGILCADPDADRMTVIDRHQSAFAGHGFCARAASDPAFDRDCFSATGHSFDQDLTTAGTAPLNCERRPAEFRAYAPRARWIRTANDSYFAAMTYPQGVGLQPADIHDATWGVLSAVYGGAIHPTAEGHAAMADALLPAMSGALGVTAETVQSAPLAPPGASSE